MTDSRPPDAFRFAPRTLAAPGSLAADVLAGGDAAALFSGVMGTGVRMGNVPSRPGRIGPDAFVATTVSARAKLEVVLGGGGHLVTTGQQPGLFLGPLYTLYKTATAIRLAAELERSTGRPALAAFWVVADDHDWDEIGVCRVLTTDEAVVPLRLVPPDGRAGRSVGEAVLPDSIGADLDRLAELAGIRTSGDDRAGFLDSLRTSYRPGETMSGAFAIAMAGVFAGHELVLLDSSLPAVRQAACGLYHDLIGRPSDVSAAMALGRDAVQRAGYKIQLNPPGAGLQLFYDGGTARRHVLATSEGFTVPDVASWSPAELAKLLDAQPTAFTPAAALRPVLESWLLPVATCVLGPGELAYWAQLRPLFQALNVEMPAVAGRDSWLLIENRVDRLLRKLRVDETVVERDSGELRRNMLDAGRPEDITRALAKLDREVGARIAELETVSDAELPGLKSAVGKARHGMERVLGDLRRVVDRGIAERESTGLEQLRRLIANLAPEGASQERTLGAAGFLAKYGSQLIEHLTRHAHVADPQSQD